VSLQTSLFLSSVDHSPKLVPFLFNLLLWSLVGACCSAPLAILLVLIAETQEGGERWENQQQMK
jgi:hypothetical protein